MRRFAPTGLAGAVVGATVLVAVCGSALAYFSATGTGEASASVTKLFAPTITAATPAVGGTVALSWSAVTAPGSGTVQYTVSRDGENAAGSCPSSSPSTVTTCTDSGVTVGTHTYTVTAKWRSWSATSEAKTAKVTVGAASEFVLSATTSTPTAGAADNLTIAAKDKNGSTVTTYTGSHSLTFSGATASPGGTTPSVVDSAGTAVTFGGATVLNFSSGVASVSSSKNGVMKLYRAGTATISVSDGTISSQTGLAVTVAAAAASKLTLTAATVTPTAGVSDDLTTTAQDTYGNTATSYTGSHSLTFSGASNSPGGNAPTVTSGSGTAVAFGTATPIVFTAGVSNASGGANGTMALFKSGSASLKVSDGTFTSAALAVTVAAGTAAKLSLNAASTTPVAGASDNLTTTALDAYGNTATSYTGSHNLTFSGANASPNGTAPSVINSSGTAVSFGGATALNFSSGVASVSSSKNGVMKLSKAETASVSATDGTISTPSGLAIAVSTGSASKLALVRVTISAGILGSPCLFTCTITSLGNSGTVKAGVGVTDSSGNTVTNLGTGHAAKVTSTGGTVLGTPLAIAGTGPAESSAEFTYTSKSSGSFTDTITAATSEGTTYTSATATASR